MEEQIQHFTHEHPLMLIDPGYGECLVCRNEIPKGTYAYSCRERFCLLSYQIDMACAKLQREMVHPFHPNHSLTFQRNASSSSSSVVSFKCDACGPISRSSNYYHCSDCGFNLDACCASLIPTKIRNVQDRQIQAQIRSLNRHPHSLIICENKNIFNVPCSGCRQPINESWICVCLECNCLLDELCAQWPSQIQNRLHPQHPLTLLVHQTWEGSASNRCSACGKVLVGFTFHCSDCNFSLDPCCASLMPLPLLPNSQGKGRGREEEEEFQIQRLNHPHPLIPCEMTKKDYTITCDACQLHFEEDSSVVYVCLECKFLLHKSCADLPLEVKHPFCHQQHTLTLLPYSIRQSEDPFVKEKPYVRPISSGKAHEFKGELQCHACTKYASGFAYVCRNPKCGIFFDIRCPVSKPWFIKSEIHHHPLPFFNDRPSLLYCTVCNIMINITPFFRCVECEFNLHPYCVPKLPPTAKDKIHRHPLALTNSPIRDYPDEHEHSEFYCDTCEEMRYLEEPTYYCEECHYVAHVHCLLPEIFPILGAYKVGETKLHMSASKALMIEEMVEEEEGVDEQEVDMATSSSRKTFPSVSTDNSSMVASKKMEGARVDGDSFLIELDKEIVELRTKAEWLAEKLNATKRRINK